MDDPITGDPTDYYYQSTNPTAGDYKADLSAYGIFSPSTSSDEGDPGVYQADMTVTDDTVDTVGFDVYDDIVYSY